MSTLVERLGGNRAQAKAIEIMRGCGYNVDETPYIKRDERFVLVRALDYAWQWIANWAKLVGNVIEKKVIWPLFSLEALRKVVTLFSPREGDFHGGLNAFLHLSGITKVMLEQFSSLEFAFKRMPRFEVKIRLQLDDLRGLNLRGPLEAALRNEEVRGVMKDPALQRQMIAHLRRIKELEFHLDDCEEARKEGDVVTPRFGLFLRDFAQLSSKSVDVVECFYQAMSRLPYTPAFYGFEVEMGREEEAGSRYIPPKLPQQEGVGVGREDDLGRGAGDVGLPPPRAPFQELRAHPRGVISLPFKPREGVGFNELMRRYFSPSGSMTRWPEEGEGRSEVRVTERRRFFDHLPSDVYFPIRRLRQAKKGHGAGKLTFHRDRLHVLFKTNLPKESGGETTHREYRLAEFVAYLGSLEFGSYAYYKKEGNQWYECIDARNRLVSEQEVRNILIDRSVLHHYTVK